MGKIAKYINIRLLLLLILLSSAMALPVWASWGIYIQLFSTDFTHSAPSIGEYYYANKLVLTGEAFSVTMNGYLYPRGYDDATDYVWMAIIKPKDNMTEVVPGSYLYWIRPEDPPGELWTHYISMVRDNNPPADYYHPTAVIDPNSEVVYYRTATKVKANMLTSGSANYTYTTIVLNYKAKSVDGYYDISHVVGGPVSGGFGSFWYAVQPVIISPAPPTSDVSYYIGYLSPNTWPDQIWGSFSGEAMSGTAFAGVDLFILDTTADEYFTQDGYWDHQEQSVHATLQIVITTSEGTPTVHKRWFFDMDHSKFAGRSGHSISLLSRARNKYGVYEQNKDLSWRTFVWDEVPPTGEASLQVYSGHGTDYITAEGGSTKYTWVRLLSNITDDVVDTSQLLMRINGDTTYENKGKWISYSPIIDFLGLTSADGKKMISADYRDQAGNIRTIGHIVRLDRTPPTGSVMINEDMPYTGTAEVTLSLYAIDYGGSTNEVLGLTNEVLVSRMASYETMRVTDWTWLGGINKYKGTIANYWFDYPTMNGNRTVYVIFKDNAGNTSTATQDSIVLNTTLPGTPTITNPLRSGSVQNITAIEGTAPQDASLNIAYVQVKIQRDDKIWNEYSGWTTSEIWKTANSTDNYRHWNIPPTYYNFNMGAYKNNYPPWEEWQTYTIEARSVGKTANVSASDPAKNIRTMTIDKSGAVISSNNITAAPDPTKSGVTITITITSDALSVDPYPPNVTVGGWNASYNYDYDPTKHKLTYNYEVSQYMWTEAGGGSWEEKDKERVNIISVVGQDAAGNTVTGEGTVTFDFTSPEGSVTIEGGALNVPSGTKNINLNLSVSDDLSPANEIHMIVWGNVTTDESWNEVFDPNQPTLSRALVPDSNGLKRVYVQYRDRVGNTSEVYSDTIYVGTIVGSRVNPFDPPYTTIESFTVTWGTGADKYTIRYKYNNGSWAPWLTGTTETSAVFTATQGEGTYYFQSTSETSGVVEIKDPATFDAYMILDRTPPTGAVAIGGPHVQVVWGKKYTQDTLVDLVLSGSDGAAGSGLFNQVFVKNYAAPWLGAPNRNVTWVDGAATVSNWSIPSGDGTKTVEVKSLDNAGNITATATWDSVYYDSKEPEILSIDTPSSTVTVPTISPISGTARDIIHNYDSGLDEKGGSGVNSVEVRVRRGTGSPYLYWDGSSSSWEAGGEAPTGFWLPTPPIPVSGSAPDNWIISSNLPVSWPTGTTEVKIYARAIDKSGRISDMFGPKTVKVNPALPYNISLTEGINWISLPYTNNYTNARSIEASINGAKTPGTSGTCTEVGKWLTSSGNYEKLTYAFGSWTGNNFTVQKGEAYYVSIKGAPTWSVSGTHDPSFAFDLSYPNGSNIYWISLPYSSTYTHAQVIVNDINDFNPGTVVEIGRQPPGGATERLTYAFGIWTGDDFAFRPGEGYYISIRKQLPNWIPK